MADLHGNAWLLCLHEIQGITCRFAIWPEVRNFIQALPHAAVVADVGCGNGKYFSVRNDVAVLGSDRSAGLAAVAMRATAHQAAGFGNAAADACIADGFHLPYKTGSMDAVLCIAVLHHISTPQRRLQMLCEVARLLQPGGQALVTVWSTKQENPARTIAKWKPVRGAALHHAATESAFARANHDGGDKQRQHQAEVRPAQQAQGADFYVPWHVPFHRVSQHMTAQALTADGREACHVAAGDCVRQPGTSAGGAVDRTKRTVMFQRYCHLYEDGELEALIDATPDVQLVSSMWDASNWVVVFERDSANG